MLYNWSYAKDRWVTTQIKRFILIGGLATGVHWLLMAGLIGIGTEPPAATAAGATGGLLANYALQKNYTFESNRAHRSALPSYLVSALFGWSINFVVFAALHMLTGWIAMTQLVASGCAAAANFLVMKHYVFHND